MTAAPAIPSQREVGALCELARLGCRDAVGALGRLLDVALEMDEPEAWVGRGPGAIADFLGALRGELVMVGLRLEGLLAGHLVLLLGDLDAQRLARLLGELAPRGSSWDSVAESAVMESGNIVGSAFVSAIADRLGERLLPSVPVLARGGGRECLEALVEGAASRVALATRFAAPAPADLEGLILLLPEEDRLAALLAALEFAYR